MASLCLDLMRSLLHPPSVLIAFIAKVGQSDCVLVEPRPPESKDAEGLKNSEFNKVACWRGVLDRFRSFSNEAT